MTRIEWLEALKIAALLGLVEEEAGERYDGHVTILRFSGGWKAAFGTPCLDSPLGREAVARLVAYPTLRKALVRLLAERPSFY